MAMAPVFDEAISQVFSRWTLLVLAVEHGWGGRSSRQKRNQLQAEVVEYLAAGSKRRRPPTHENESDVEALATLIYTRLDEFFNVEADDGSDMEVATLCLRLFTTCRMGDFSFAQQFLQAMPSAPVDLSKCQGVDVTQYATDEDKLLDQMQAMEVESGGDSGSEDDADAAMGEVRPPLAGEHSQQYSDQLAHPAAQEAGQVGAGGIGKGVGAPRAPPPEPVVDEDGFTSVVKGRRRPR
uniref:Pre-rRNA-processing protein TSR2 n=1 Tax=Alexandrium monilatum TaxID=311494 RepID=A0A7S4R0X5_9DINO